MKHLKLIFRRNPIYESCPDCGLPGTLHRSRARSFFEKILKRFFIQHYRCKKCGWRGKRLMYTFTWDSVKNLAFYLFIAVIAAVIIRFILTKFIIIWIFFRIMSLRPFGTIENNYLYYSRFLRFIDKLQVSYVWRKYSKETVWV